MADDTSNMIAALQGNLIAPTDGLPMRAARGAVNALGNAASNIWNLPQKMIEGSANDVSNLGDHSQPLQSVPPATDAAMMLAGSGAPMAEAGAAGIFGGRLAAGADLQALNEANKMKSVGLHSDDIWKDTGWFQSPTDQKWRFEIPDNKATLEAPMHMLGQGDTVRGHMNNMANHEPLFQAYPELRYSPTEVTKDASYPKGRGQFDPAARGKINIIAPNPEIGRSVMLHELQHGVQGIEGFTPGTTSNYYARLIEKGLRNDPSIGHGIDYNAIKDQAVDFYKRTAGEVEARNAQARMDMTPGQRLDLAPWYTQPVPFENQLVIDRATGMVNVLRKK